MELTKSGEDYLEAILVLQRRQLRVHMKQRRMSLAQAGQLEERLGALPAVREVKVYDRTCDVVIRYGGDRQRALQALAAFRYDRAALAEFAPESSSRALSRTYQDKLVSMTLFLMLRKLYFPAPLRIAYTVVQSVRFIWKGLRCLLAGKLVVEVLDAASIMFLLRVGGLLEAWTRKKSMGDLARSLSLKVDRVWLRVGETEVLTPSPM